MDLSASTFWWAAAGVAVAAELATGTFYLLMIALGLGAAALVAQVGFTGSAQLVAAAAVGGGATAFWHWRRTRQGASVSAPARTNRDVNLDIGERIEVTAWAPDRTARVKYRGSLWTAHLAPGAAAAAGAHVVTAVEGNWLVLAPSV